MKGVFGRREIGRERGSSKERGGPRDWGDKR